MRYRVNVVSNPAYPLDLELKSGAVVRAKVEHTQVELVPLEGNKHSAILLCAPSGPDDLDVQQGDEVEVTFAKVAAEGGGK